VDAPEGVSALRDLTSDHIPILQGLVIHNLFVNGIEFDLREQDVVITRPQLQLPLLSAFDLTRSCPVILVIMQTRPP